MSKKPACIIRPHRAGLFSLINNVATCAELYESVHVDWNESPLLIYQGAGNLWDYLFANNHTPALRANIVCNYPDQHLTYKHVAAHYLDPADPWRRVYNAHWRAWRPHVAWIAKAGKFIGDIGGPYVAVQVRNDGHAGEQTSGQSQTLGAYLDALITELIGVEHETGRKPSLVVVASNHDSIRQFSELCPGYKVVAYPHSRRAYKRSDPDFHLEQPQTFEDAAHCLVEVMIMSQANALIHPVSNMATGALYMNPNLRSVYIP